ASDVREKIALFCNVPTEAVIAATDVGSIYEVPQVFNAGGLDELVVRELGLTADEPDLRAWADFVECVVHPARQCEIAIVGKYTHMRDAYKSILEAFVHAGAAHRARVRVRWIEGEALEQTGASEPLSGVDGIVVPGGFGERGIEGKILAAQFARERGIPYLGLCLGMQVATIELPDHPWFLAVQFHPELKSRPHEPHPLFADFVRAALERRRVRLGDDRFDASLGAGAEQRSGAVTGEHSSKGART